MSERLGIAIAQLNLIVGDLPGNVASIAGAAAEAKSELGCRIVVCPELAISGYPPEDLLLREDFMRDCQGALDALAAQAPRGMTLVVGHPMRRDGRLYNAASVIEDGEIVAVYCKHHLPNYGVFDERRYFVSGDAPCVRPMGGVPTGIVICEDLWSDGPVESAVAQGARLVVALNGSPFNIDKPGYREIEIVGKRASANGVSIVYANLVGGQDELVFDGGSFVVDTGGNVAARLPQFEQCVRRIEFDVDAAVTPRKQALRRASEVKTRSYAEIVGLRESGRLLESAARLDEIYRALKLGVADYVRKNGFNGALVGLSGGIDSALTLAIVADAIGPDRVKAVLMPSRHTHKMSVDDARSEADALGVESAVISIEPIYQAVLDQLAEEFAGEAADITEENIQARCRGLILMAISNKQGRIVITTGNKSEVAVGYATLYGDMAGGFGAIKDVPKRMVYELAEYRNVALGEVIPQRVFTRAPSAELADDQRDEDSLPAYHVLDEILEGYVEEDRTVEELVERGFSPEIVRHVVSLVKRNEYKRKQAAPGVRITHKAFGRDRRYPITNRY